MNRHQPVTLRTAGDHVREWRRRRRLSQLDFALDAGISQKHLCFIETGRAHPSRDMLLRLASELGVPLREQNAMLLAGGYAPVFAERSLDDPALAPARAAIDLILKGHEPYPALAVDRHWRLVAHNAPVAALLGLVSDRSLLERGVDVLTLSLAPAGWRRISRIWRNGGRTSWNGCAGWSRPPQIRVWWNCSAPWRRFPARMRPPIRRAISPACSCLSRSRLPPESCRSSRR